MNPPKPARTALSLVGFTFTLTGDLPLQTEGVTTVDDLAADAAADDRLLRELRAMPHEQLARRAMSLTIERDLAIATAADMQQQFAAEVRCVEGLRRELEITNRHRVES